MECKSKVKSKGYRIWVEKWRCYVRATILHTRESLNYLVFRDVRIVCKDDFGYVLYEDIDSGEMFAVNSELLSEG